MSHKLTRSTTSQIRSEYQNRFQHLMRQRVKFVATKYADFRFHFNWHSSRTPLAVKAGGQNDEGQDD